MEGIPITNFGAVQKFKKCRILVVFKNFKKVEFIIQLYAARVAVWQKERNTGLDIHWQSVYGIQSKVWIELSSKK
jgi:hypothetical protein